MRKIPSTMATQHPDNACVPYWKEDNNPFVSTLEEIGESHLCFNELGCEEFMWDWEGKYVDEAVVDKLFHRYYEFFKENQIGRDKFLTFRIPNIWKEKGYTLCRAIMVILTAENFARDLKLNTPPLFEVILPMADCAEKLIYIQKTFTELAHFKNKLFNEDTTFDYIHIMPLVEGVEHLFSLQNLLEKYFYLHYKEYKKWPEYQRIHIARSDPALNSGLVPAVVAAKVGMSEAYKFGEARGVEIFPALGVGTMPFRGSLSPLRIDDFIKEYSGLKTVYVQSAFRYDFQLSDVKSAIKNLNENLQKTPPRIFTDKETKEADRICKIFELYYKESIEKIADTINEIADHIPKRRERKLHIGLFGYSRAVGKKKLPRAIPLAGSMYSLGVPIEFVGTGRGLKALEKTDIDIEKYYLNIVKDLTWAGQYLNKENLEKLCIKNDYWKKIKQDIDFVEDYFGIELGPKNPWDFTHQELTTEIFDLWEKGNLTSTPIIKAGKIRQSIG